MVCRAHDDSLTLPPGHRCSVTEVIAFRPGLWSLSIQTFPQAYRVLNIFKKKVTKKMSNGSGTTYNKVVTKE